ncbi:type 1 glutamine amidotransferase domain-containing protein [Hahella aquimaris]|uniref:type 1 glutamine amidotransferase domain-containing protein n=1 Tax=Hahella sp. HNIBRBA332 TaxID=3015983 RepID=UPI00273BB804|nr:type 1 glutamine amidotransferase domain-containing protein [Hahella sp. HNIBRBA332]WLQ16492.1 type 1 glutamine amidotransferase domain-containing protein [Hahella sp. HNIBRBA332]
MNINEAKVLIIATHGFEQSELEVPRDRLRDAGVTVHVASLQTGRIRGWSGKDWGEEVPVDKTVQEVDVEDYHALVLPGGQINPDLLRVEKTVVDLIHKFNIAEKPIAAICHGPWLLIEAQIVRGIRATSYQSIITDMKNAGAEWVDEATVRDRNIITARHPGDLDAFVSAIKDAIASL